ncbi:MAG: hypothetical protein QME88_06000 [Actinomycetota bacterium]|nr:hypothetical protein [Actinomycetota bacterium]
MKSSSVSVILSSLAAALAAALFLSVPGSVLAQEEKPEGNQEEHLDEEQGKEVPPELKEKLGQLKEAMRELRKTLAPLTKSIREYVRENRSAWMGEQESWREGIAKRRELAKGLREKMAPLKLVAETTRVAREAIRADLRAAWEAWDAGDTRGAVEKIDQALVKIEELKRTVSDALGSG